MNKTLTREKVKELCLNKVKVITADMLDGYTKIGYRAFYCCSGLTSITIPNSVTSIGGSAFYGCNSLTAVHISDIAAWCKIAFGNGLSNPLYYAHNLYLNGTLITDLVIPNSVTSIERETFYGCSNLKSITIPNSITSIGTGAFYCCRSLISVTIGGVEYKTQIVTNGKCKAYKAFNADMTCRNFQYEEGETYEFDGEPELCECGFHACLKLSDVFDYYAGEFGKNVVVCEVELEGVTEEHAVDSKVVAKKITIGKRIL